MLDFELLRTFVAVADCGGFHRAAERLNLTQSTVSQQIKRLELETKRPLFRRTRSVALTDDGEMLLGDARRLLQLEEAARQRQSGTVRLGVVEEVAGGSLPSALGLSASSSGSAPSRRTASSHLGRSRCSPGALFVNVSSSNEVRHPTWGGRVAINQAGRSEGIARFATPPMAAL
jgi:hypothetical protein